MQVYDWKLIEKEELNASYARQVVHSDSMTIARTHFKKGYLVADHSHPNEQVSMVEQGALKFVVDGEEHLVRPGEVLCISANRIHSALALGDCVMVEVFSPRRQDWIDAKTAK